MVPVLRPDRSAAEPRVLVGKGRPKSTRGIDILVSVGLVGALLDLARQAFAESLEMFADCGKFLVYEAAHRGCEILRRELASPLSDF